MSYDFELKFNPSQRQSLIKALRDFDPTLDVSDMSSDDLPLTFGRRQNPIKKLLDRTLMLAFRIWVGQVTELTSTSTPVQISIFKNSAGLHVSLADNQNSAKAVFDKAWDYLQVMQRVCQCATFDRQLEKKLDLDSDFDTAFQTYCSVAQGVKRVFKEFDR